MRILIVTNHFLPESFRINDLAFGLRDRGHHITVLTGLPDYPGGKAFDGYGVLRRRDEVVEGVRVVRFPRVPRGDGRPWRQVTNYVSGALGSSLVAPLLAGQRFDVIFVFETSPVTIGLPALLLRRLRGVPVIFWVLDLWPESLSATGAVRSERLLRLARRAVRFIYRRCDHLLVSSRGFVQSIRQTGGYDGEITYFPNWVEPEYLDPPATDVALPDLPEGFRILFAGNIGAAQDFDTLLDAAELLKDEAGIQWVILGDGRRAAWVREQVQARGLSHCFHLLGRFPADTMTAFFSRADAMLMSLRREPIFALTAPGKLQSYMASARPILACLDGEGADLINEAGCGLACPAGRSDLLAANIRALRAMDRSDRDAMGARGKAYCDAHFDRDKLFDRLESLMLELGQRS